MNDSIRFPSPRGAFRVWQRNATIFRKYWKSILFPNFVEPLLYLAALGLGPPLCCGDAAGPDTGRPGGR